MHRRDFVIGSLGLAAMARLDALATLLIPMPLSPSRKAELSEAGRGDASDHLVVRRLLSLPESQVG